MNNRKLIVGNWKMNPATLAEAKKISAKTKKVAGNLLHTEVVVCPPFVFMKPCMPKNTTPHFSIGAQNVSFESEGAHTGEVSADMLYDLGVRYVILGHSEERSKGDTDALVSRRIQASLSAGLHPIVCVGEKERDESGAYLETLKEQIKNTFAGIDKKYARNIILAYEPVWTIGANEAMNTADIYETSLFVKKVFADIFGQDEAMKIRVLYGGAVNFRNASDILTLGKVDGLLVGRESVNLPGFVELLKAVDAVK